MKKTLEKSTRAAGDSVQRFVRHFAGRWWDLVHRHEILRAMGELPVCYDDVADPEWRGRKDSILRKLKRHGLIRHSTLKRDCYRIISEKCMPNK